MANGEKVLIFELADALKAKRDEKKRLEEAVKQLNGEIEEVEQALVQSMTDEEMQNFSRSGQLFYLQTKTHASAKAELKDELYQWLKDNNYGELVKETVNAQTLSGFIKELLEEQDELPEDLAALVNVFEKTTVGIRKAK